MRNIFARKAVEGPEVAFPTKTNTTLSKVLDNYDLVEVVENAGDPFVIVSERSSLGSQALALRETPKQLLDVASNTDMVDLRELGSSSPSPFTSFARREYNRDLVGIQGLKKYDQMRRGDGVVRGTLRLVKTPVLSAHWYMEPASDKKADQTCSDFVWDNLTKQMSISWTQVLTETMLMADFGYYMFEKVWEERIINGQKRLIWKKLAPRHPMDVVPGGWKYDANGGPLGVEMFPASADPSQQNIFIPIDKLLVFSFDQEAGNLEGISVLRSAYKHWYYKDQLYKIDAIQKERHGIGIPVIKLPPGFSNDDKLAANELGRNLRTNERAHVVLPPNWELLFAKLEGHVVNALDSVKIHDQAIRENVLGGFLGADYSTKDEDQTMFLKATRFIGNIVASTFNTHGIPDLVEKNFVRAGIPSLCVRGIGEEEDQRTLSFTIRNMVGAGVIRPDDKLEDYVRKELDLPARDIETTRDTGNVRETISVPGALGPNGEIIPGVQPGANAPTSGSKPPKQNGAQAGQPRQTPPSATPPRGNGGIDRSGGK